MWMALDGVTEGRSVRRRGWPGTQGPPLAEGEAEGVLEPQNTLY